MQKENDVVDWFALLLKVSLAVIVLIFLGSESIAFFTFIFPPEQWFMAYTGFSLTSGSLLVYLFLFLKNAKTPLQKTVSIIMMAVGIIGELATAGFGMQIEAWTKQGWAMTQSDFAFMVLAVRGMMFAHAVALLAYSFGDDIRHAFDKNNNGVLDILENKQPTTAQPMKANQQVVETPALDVSALLARISELEKAQASNPPKPPTQ